MKEHNKQCQTILNNNLQHVGDLLMTAMFGDMPFTGSKKYLKQIIRPCIKQLG